jgi:apoptosis-inducing factor 3
MGSAQEKPRGPDLTQGLSLAELADRQTLLGHVGEDAVVVARCGEEIFAIGANCTHYGGPLAEGLLVDDTIRCPWHHACFSLRTGEALHAPAFDPVACWSVERRGGKFFVQAKKQLAAAAARPRPAHLGKAPDRIVIIGGGAAGFAAAERLRRENYQGQISILSDDDAPPVDRPNLSKDYLAGHAPEEWVPLRPDSYWGEQGIDLRLGTKVVALDVGAREVSLGDGAKIAYDRLLLATGAEPIRLSIPGADQPHVHVLRSLANCRAIIARATTAKRAVVLGASFIGLEVAAALRARNLEVHVVAPDRRPMQRILGPQLGAFVQALHSQRGVLFHLEDKASAITGTTVELDSGSSLAADLVVAGIGVRPRVAIPEKAGLALDRGVLVDAYLQTSAPGVFAAGDIARWPDAHSGASIRVEHWVVAERQGQTAALNMLGHQVKFAAVPYFWSQHYDVPINYVGHAESWDDIEIDGDVEAGNCLVRYKQAGHLRAVASINRDAESLQAELSLEQQSS